MAVSPLKDIAIYRLQRVEKALGRLDAAVSRLETAGMAVLERAEAASTLGEQTNGQQIEIIEAELEGLRKDYDALRTAATSVADRLDATISKYENGDKKAAE